MNITRKAGRLAQYIFAAALAFGAAGCGHSSLPASSSASTSTPKPTAGSAAQPPAASAAKPAAATPQDGMDVLSILSVEHEVDVLSQRDGTVVQIAKDDGSRVRVGELLAKLDDRSLLAQLDRARADLQVAQNNVKYQDAELTAKRANYRRQQQLRELGLGSQADLEQAQFQATGAEYDLASYKSAVDRAQADIRARQIELEQTQIRAPFAGVVARRFLSAGQHLAKGDKCFRVSQLAPLLVHFQIPESARRPPRLRDEVRLALADDPAKSYVARITKISPVIDPASDSYDITAQLLHPDLAVLRPGMAVHVSWPKMAIAHTP